MRMRTHGFRVWFYLGVRLGSGWGPAGRLGGGGSHGARRTRSSVESRDPRSQLVYL